LMRGRQRVEL